LRFAAPAKPARRRSQQPSAAAYAPRELDDHSIRLGQKTFASMSAAFEAALGQLGLIERNDLATMAIAKVMAAAA
jgi:hypothetical protein